MDLGTANTIIISDDKIVVDEPSVVALDRRTDKMIAVGEKAKMMYEKTNDNIRTIRPLRDGVIADFTACEQMMRGLIKMVHTGSRLFSPSLRMVIGVPSGSTEVELRAVRDSAEHADGRDVYLIFEPMAAAIGIGIDVEAPEGNMIVDIGGGSTEIAVISLGGIVSNNSIRTAGDDLTAEIQEYMSKQHNVKVSERMAERIKIHVGSALTDLGEEAPEVLTAFIEMVPTDTVKYELDKVCGYIKIDRPQKYSNVVPALYGFIPQSYCGDSVAEYAMQQSQRSGIKGDCDPLDICVLTERTIAHGDIIASVRPIGGFRMFDGDEADDKIIAVLKHDATYNVYNEIDELPHIIVDRLKHYFLTYKDMPGEEGMRKVDISQVYGREEAYEVIRRSLEDYKKHFEGLDEILSRV